MHCLVKFLEQDRILILSVKRAQEVTLVPLVFVLVVAQHVMVLNNIQKILLLAFVLKIANLLFEVNLRVIKVFEVFLISFVRSVCSFIFLPLLLRVIECHHIPHAHLGRLFWSTDGLLSYRLI